MKIIPLLDKGRINIPASMRGEHFGPEQNIALRFFCSEEGTNVALYPEKISQQMQEVSLQTLRLLERSKIVLGSQSHRLKYPLEYLTDILPYLWEEEHKMELQLTDAQGKIVLPADIRKAANWNPGDSLFISRPTPDPVLLLSDHKHSFAGYKQALDLMIKLEFAPKILQKIEAVLDKMDEEIFSSLQP